MAPNTNNTRKHTLETRPRNIDQFTADHLLELAGLDELDNPASPKIKAALSQIECVIGWYEAAARAQLPLQARTGRPRVLLRNEFIKRALAIFHRYRYRPSDEKFEATDVSPTLVEGRDDDSNPKVISCQQHHNRRTKWVRPVDEQINRPDEAIRPTKGAMSALSELESREREFIQALLGEVGIAIKPEALRKALKEVNRHPEDWARRRQMIAVKTKKHRQKHPRTWSFPEL